VLVGVAKDLLVEVSENQLGVVTWCGSVDRTCTHCVLGLCRRLEAVSVMSVVLIDLSVVVSSTVINPVQSSTNTSTVL
jgi:hypothetical protein